MTIAIIRSLSTLRSVVNRWKRSGERIAVVPTMGALHAGHLSLAREGRKLADRLIVTVFVNPKQFDNPDDLAKYPRTESEDAMKLGPLGVDVLYAPEIGTMYPEGFATTISIKGVSEGLCGANRPGHFDGVATVVTKLLMHTGADIALFGEKDFQQLHVIRRLVRDLDLPVEIRACPTMREQDGLAMSSRNMRLDVGQRQIAKAFPQILHHATQQISANEDVTTVLKNAHEALIKAGFTSVDYLELRAEDDLRPLKRAEVSARLLAAVWLQDIRLIDNMPVAPVVV